jgi:hypothetical protein
MDNLPQLLIALQRLKKTRKEDATHADTNADKEARTPQRR